jgi:hypothetical protein
MSLLYEVESLGCRYVRKKHLRYLSLSRMARNVERQGAMLLGPRAVAVASLG